MNREELTNDLESLFNTHKNHHGKNPNTIIMTKEVYNFLFENDKVIEYKDCKIEIVERQYGNFTLVGDMWLDSLEKFGFRVVECDNTPCYFLNGDRYEKTTLQELQSPFKRARDRDLFCEKCDNTKSDNK